MKFTARLWRAAVCPLTYSLLELHLKKKKEEERMGRNAFWDMLARVGSAAAFLNLQTGITFLHRT